MIQLFYFVWSRIATCLMISWSRLRRGDDITKDVTMAAERGRGLVNVKTIGQATYFAITETGEDIIRELFDKFTNVVI
jgi:hypothetical protein